MNEKAEVEPSQNVKENPLNNSVILENIFKFVDCVEDLRNVRLTNSLWLKESWKPWESLAIYHIIPDKPYRECNCQPRTNESQHHKRTYSLQDFFAKWESVGPRNRQLMRHFRLTGFCLVHPPTDKVYSDLIRLFDLVGSNVAYLNLDHCTFYRSKYFNGFKWILSKLFNLQSLIVILDKTCVLQPQDSEELQTFSPKENLTELSFIRCKVKIQHYDDCYPIIPDNLFRYLVKMTPNVNTLEINISMLTDVSVNALTRPQPNTLPWRLTNLTLTDHWMFRQILGAHVDDLIIYIRNTLPTLKAIKLVVVVKTRNVNALIQHFRRLLATCQNSLKELDVTREKLEKREVPRPISGCLRGLHFPLLTHLYITGESSISFTSLRGAPNLKSLHFKSALKHDWNQLIAAEGDSPEGGEAFLEKLEDFYSNYSFFISKRLGILKKWMPNIKEMGIVVTQKTKPVVLELWLNLDRLVLIKGSVLVEGEMPISSDVVQAEKGSVTMNDYTNEILFF